MLVISLYYCRIDYGLDDQFPGTIHVRREPYQATANKPLFYFQFGPHIISGQDEGWPTDDDGN